jgi:hypothetical protein
MSLPISFRKNDCKNTRPDFKEIEKFHPQVWGKYLLIGPCQLGKMLVLMKIIMAYFLVMAYYSHFEC